MNIEFKNSKNNIELFSDKSEKWKNIKINFLIF